MSRNRQTWGSRRWWAGGRGSAPSSLMKVVSQSGRLGRSAAGLSMPPDMTADSACEGRDEMARGCVRVFGWWWASTCSERISGET